ncbi:MAG: DUF6089 family protein [Bacteroidota bacterium]
MKRLSTIILSSLIFTTFLSAQPNRGYISVGLSAGLTNYKGDLSGIVNSLRYTRPGVGIEGAYRFHSHMGARLTFFQGWIASDDFRSNEELVRARNLRFRSPVTEFSAQLTFDLFPVERSYERRPTYSPFVFGGISVFSFNPQGLLDGEWFDLKPLGTEGQFLPDPNNVYPETYNLTQLSVPFGAGLRVAIARQWNVSVEAGIRMTFTDYLDDVSGFYPDLDELRAQNPTAALLSDRSIRDPFTEGKQAGDIRGNPNFNDWYAYSNITISFILDSVKCPAF